MMRIVNLNGRYDMMFHFHLDDCKSKLPNYSTILMGFIEINIS